MSGKEQNAKTSEQGGVVETVKEAGKGVSNEISKQTGGSQVCFETAQFSLQVRCTHCDGTVRYDRRSEMWYKKKNPVGPRRWPRSRVHLTNKALLEVL